MHRSMPRLISFLAALAVVLASAHAGVPDSLRRSPTSPSGRGGVWVVRDSTPGVVWKSATYSGGVYGSQVVNLLDIDPALVTIRPARTASDSSYESVLSMGKRTGAVAGVNGGFFCNTTDDICSPLACKAPPQCPHGVVTPRSLLIIDGELRSANCSTRTTFGLPPKGTPLIQQVGAGKGWAGVSQAVGAGPNLVSDGLKHITSEGFCWYGEKAARTSIATTPTGHVLMVTFDEGYPGATGMTIDKLADFMLAELGVASAMNLDGGGSTTMYYDGKIVNHPSDNSCDGCCRCVYDGVFIYAK